MLRGRYAYGLAIGTAAFLLFLSEPLLGKRILPFFGGSTSVWAGSLLFFTGALFIGYAYAYVLARYGGVRQGRIHALVALAAMFALGGAGAAPLSTASPLLSVVLTLMLWIGLPFAFLASTGPLLQRWYADTHGEPYGLYALSNAASFIALLAYPFVLEPRFSLQATLHTWVALFVLLAILIGSIAVSLRAGATRVARIHTTRREFLLWLGYAAVPAVLLVSTTTQLTQVIAPVPLLWILPLAAYLLSFVVAFRGYGDTDQASALVVISAGVAYALTPASTPLVGLQMLSYLALLFFASARCHARLFAMRPLVDVLPLFYLTLSLGGFLGTALVAFLAPLVFDDYWEFPLAVAIVSLVAIMRIQGRATGSSVRAAKIIASVAVLAASTAFVSADKLSSTTAGTTERERNFYGVTTLVRTPEAIALVHGRTLHGLELLGASSTVPTTYYTPSSGIGRAVAYERSISMALRVATIGLGTGTLAAYCREGDVFVFYEIDPRIERLARRDFDYVRNCKGSEVRLGDGRVTLRAEIGAPEVIAYDLIAIDAFNSDAIPLHLLTREALALYAARLTSERSIIAFHISNRYLDLAPELIRLAADGGFGSMVIRDEGSKGTLGVPTTWVLMARDSGIFKKVAFAQSDSKPPRASETVWTDDHASVWDAVSMLSLGNILR